MVGRMMMSIKKVCCKADEELLNKEKIIKKISKIGIEKFKFSLPFLLYLFFRRNFQRPHLDKCV
jgi:hypothetical protein